MDYLVNTCLTTKRISSMGCGSSVQVLQGPHTQAPSVGNGEEHKDMDDPELPEENHPFSEIHNEDRDCQVADEDNNDDTTEEESQGSDVTSDEERDSNPSPQPEIPPVLPPTTLKKDVFNPESYVELDNQAKTVAQELTQSTLDELVRHLTANCTTDMSKLRSIFSWLTSIDIQSLEHVVEILPDPHTPLDFLLKLQWRLTNYAYFFAQLCWLAGLPCYVIDGINKSAAYEVGDVIEPGRLAAQWNGVLVDGQWRLLDVFWASTCVVGRQSRDWALIEDDDVTSLASHDEEGYAQHVVNEFFFIPDPEVLSWTHLPNDHRWQLTDETISFEEFQNRVYLRERFFDLGMTLPEEQRECMVNTKNGEVTLTFGVPPLESQNYQFRYVLYKQRVTTAEDQKFASLDQFVYFTKSLGQVLYQARFPVHGLFRMDVYGRDIRRHETFDLVCSYVIRCLAPKPGCQPLPDNPEIGWGPGVEARSAGLNPITHDDGTIFTDDGKVQIRFQNSKDTSVLQSLKNNDLDEWLLRRHAVVYTEGNQLIVDLRLPSSGEYALNLFGDQDKADEHYGNVCNYLIHCTNTSGNEPFPKLHEGVLGRSEAAEALGIESPEGPKNIIETDGDSKTIKFKHSDDVELFCELYHSDNDRLAMADRVFRITENGGTTFNLEVGVAGLYGVNVYARKINSGDFRLYHVHTYLLDNKSDGLHSDDVTNDEDLDVELYELETNTKHTAITIPRFTKDSTKLLAELKQRYSQNQNDLGEVKGELNEKDYSLDVYLPEIGEYTLDLYQGLDTGALIHKTGYLIYRDEGPENEKDDNSDEDAKVEKAAAQDELIQPETPQPIIDPEEVARIQKRKIKKEKQRLLRQQLKEAMRSRDEVAILEAIANLKDSGIPADNRRIMKAEEFLVYMRLSQVLQSAMAARDLKELEKLAQEIVDRKMERKMGLQLAMARRIIGQLRRIQELRHDILRMDQTTVAELKSYANPPHQVHMVMMGTLVLLGELEYSMKEWKSVQAMIGKTGKSSLKRRVSHFRADSVSADSARAAKRILCRYDVDEVRDVSAGAATFFVWSMGMLEEIQNIQEQHGGPTLKSA